MLIVLLAAGHNGHVRWHGVSVGLCQCKGLSLCCPSQRELHVSVSRLSLRSDRNTACASALHQTLVTVGRGRWHLAADGLLLLLPLDCCSEVLCPDWVLPVVLEQPLVAIDLWKSWLQGLPATPDCGKVGQADLAQQQTKKVEAVKIGLKPKWKQEVLLLRLNFRLRLMILEPRLELIPFANIC